MSADAARLTVTTVVRNAGDRGRTATVHVDVAGVSAEATRRRPGRGERDVELPVVVPHPHLWDGRADPFQYPVHASVDDAGHVTDAVDEPVGFAVVPRRPEHGFSLNGHPYRLYGVNRHQDRLDKGWAESADDEAGDAANIMDLGCTAVRLSHYEQSPSFYDLMDAAGIVVWAEVPLVNNVTPSAAFATTPSSSCGS